MTTQEQAAALFSESMSAIVGSLPKVAEMATKEERDAVVAFLRGDPEWPSCPACRDAQLYAHADAIERGEHRKGEP